MISGLSFQVFSLFVFMCLCADFAVRARKNRADPSGALRRCGCGVAWFYGFLVGMYPHKLHELWGPSTDRCSTTQQ